jgi:hypothetical protein
MAQPVTSDADDGAGRRIVGRVGPHDVQAVNPTADSAGIDQLDEPDDLMAGGACIFGDLERERSCARDVELPCLISHAS